MTMSGERTLTPELCRIRSEECVRHASEARLNSHRLMLAHMAQTWLQIAADIESEF